VRKKLALDTLLNHCGEDALRNSIEAPDALVGAIVWRLPKSLPEWMRALSLECELSRTQARVESLCSGGAPLYGLYKTKKRRS